MARQRRIVFATVGLGDPCATYGRSALQLCVPGLLSSPPTRSLTVFHEQSTEACNDAAGEDRTHDLRIMRPTCYQLRYCRSASCVRAASCNRQLEALCLSPENLGYASQRSHQPIVKINRNLHSSQVPSKQKLNHPLCFNADAGRLVQLTLMAELGKRSRKKTASINIERVRLKCFCFCFNACVFVFFGMSEMFLFCFSSMSLCSSCLDSCFFLSLPSAQHIVQPPVHTIVPATAIHK